MNFRLLLVGNYRLDQQMSMLQYHDMLLQELGRRGVAVESIEPGALFGKISAGPLTKWLRYIDKYFLFPGTLKRRVAAAARAASAEGAQLIVHITDHSNAPYLTYAGKHSVVSTCHDLLAVRGALGEDTDCPASSFGKLLQSKILAGLRQSQLVICVSKATEGDLNRLAPETSSTVIPLPLNQPYSVLPHEETTRRLASADSRLLDQPYILHVGSSLKRKNREGILRIFARIAGQFPGKLVFAGEKLHTHQHQLAAELGLTERVIEISGPSSSVIEALYNRAFAFVFPSKTEGFGWPIIEAQACGCPVLAARTTSLPEVLGDGGFLLDLDDEEGFANALLALQDSSVREAAIQRGFRNLERFGTDRIIDQYLAAYQSLTS
ncbi:MAG TPA: glycosyltransferase family 1 protein [Chthoniobacterales bacterium]|jgi:glycosyltransferase involved in cell wall biosynthesis